jgi:ATP-dependent RNA helicase DDX1
LNKFCRFHLKLIFKIKTIKIKTNDYVGIAQAQKENVIISQKSSGGINRGAIKREINAPLALIIEPSKELAEQTFKQIQTFKQYLKNPNIKEVLIVGKNF